MVVMEARPHWVEEMVGGGDGECGSSFAFS